MNRQFILATFSIALSFVPTAGYTACRELSLAEAFQGADAVIEAEILAGQPHSMRGWKKVQLRQRKVWKKSKVPMDTILDFVASPERPPLVVGDTYLLFLERPVDGKLTIGKCSPRTHRLPVTKDEVLELQQLTSGSR